ncbi:hypothetical protein [Streptomyces sp. NPDC057966]|uniref:hypothetical protein n=1 Tax=Streptomyces sp. NPDC057966 TaxID=3346292 RepID=UPI0036E2099A
MAHVAVTGEGAAESKRSGIPDSSGRKGVPISAEFDVPPENRCPAVMARDTGIDDEASHPDSLLELRSGEHSIRVGNVSERVQLAVVAGLFVTAITALLVNAYTSTRSPQAADEATPVP